MSSHFKITTWGDYGTMQIRAAASSIFLDKEDVQRLREHFENEKKAEAQR